MSMDVDMVDLTDLADEDIETGVELIDLTEDLDELPPSSPGIATNSIRADTSREAVHNLLSPTAHRRQIELPFVQLDSIIVSDNKNMRLKIGDFGELKATDGSPIAARKGDFLQIHNIVQDVRSDEVTIHGLILKRTYKDGGRLPPKMNELYLDVNVCLDDDRTPYEQNVKRIKVSDIVKKRKVNVTNALYPKFTFRDHGAYDSRDRRAREAAFLSYELACRWIRISYFRNARDMLQERPSLTVQRLLREDEANPAYRVTNAELIRQHKPGRPHPQRQQYTMCDAFCGLGGVSLGARQAGVLPAYAFDHDFGATSTYVLNQDGTRIYTESVEDFIQLVIDQGIRVDVLHLSPPCQPFSQAHTRPGQNDEMNQAVLFSIHQLLETLRPRLVTLEEAAWLVRAHKDWFKAVLKMFADCGYSVTYKIINCKDYSLPENRERVILFASMPGVALPEIPQPTHGPAGSGLRPYNTIADALAKLARHPEATHNEIAGMHAPVVRAYPPYDANIIAPCITTGGGDGRPGTYHPSGTRDFTLRELATLQGFPPTFEFAGGLTTTAIRRQIGNAVPPPLAKALFRAIRSALEREDAELARL